MSTPDDLPWPELGNVSRGATRGNQGQKGVLGPPDRDGRCLLQLRVQPGVLAVKLNRQASEWYRMLDNEVNRALKLTKTYWRKARRRQDYDARADQDHMELHEWLQQLKDKTMSHLELLMQKGDIQGPPYVMPDDVELTFLRKFVERQNAGIPHNPRLRNTPGAAELYTHREHSAESFSPEPSDQGFIDPQHSHPDRQTNDIVAQLSHSRASESPSLLTAEALAAEANSSKQTLQAARVALLRAQKDTQDAFMRYTSCLDLERQARQAVQAAEKRRDDIVAVILQRNQLALVDARSRKSSVSEEQRHSPARYGLEQPPPPPQQPQQQHQPQPQDMRHSLDPFIHAARVPQKPMEWPEPDPNQVVYNTDGSLHLEDHSRARKHSRTWDQPQLQDNPYATCEDMSMPPRKRIHHMMTEFDVMGASLQPPNMSLAPS
ncbi:hypothetical protein CC1G_06908 [Coprinopsis cinerea okayama7|uniref:Uncharacterized protein n=1 Tax=Coprinopsis cinerea (strain Okayama-7 / 130 / ATCC MYA-4618 / FGSC 9003) TaxID=240176 RepID=A8NZM0_COPC7|nr:hypothetical protein CC1G_06908 [Coprinopsis cinerea okayama7\|eukprot:XP_001837702.2 hypothetical protein CC1G_06908 [Coprinopsis cinerea okayama7\